MLPASRIQLQVGTVCTQLVILPEEQTATLWTLATEEAQRLLRQSRDSTYRHFVLAKGVFGVNLGMRSVLRPFGAGRQVVDAMQVQ